MREVPAVGAVAAGAVAVGAVVGAVAAGAAVEEVDDGVVFAVATVFIVGGWDCRGRSAR